MDKYEDDIHNVSRERLAEMLEQYAHRHEGLERETMMEAARRLKCLPEFVPYERFDSEAFDI